MKNKSTRKAQRDWINKLNYLMEVWETSEFSAVIGPFRENKQHLRFVGNAVVQLQRLESDIISDLINLDDVEDDDVQSCVLEHLLGSTENIGRMVRILEATRDRAWALMDEADGTALKNEAEFGGAKSPGLEIGVSRKAGATRCQRHQSAGESLQAIQGKWPEDRRGCQTLRLIRFSEFSYQS